MEGMTCDALRQPHLWALANKSKNKQDDNSVSGYATRKEFNSSLFNLGGEVPSMQLTSECQTPFAS